MQRQHINGYGLKPKLSLVFESNNSNKLQNFLNLLTKHQPFAPLCSWKFVKNNEAYLGLFSTLLACCCCVFVTAFVGNCATEGSYCCSQCLEFLMFPFWRSHQFLTLCVENDLGAESLAVWGPAGRRTADSLSSSAHSACRTSDV